jgi:hypothetical protein
MIPYIEVNTLNMQMNKIIFLATITILTGVAVLATTAMTSAIAQEMMDNATMTGNMTGGNMTGGNITEDVGRISGGGKCNELC